MIDKIESLRGKMSKAQLCRLSDISLSQYYNYLKGSQVPYNVIERMINALGYKLIIIKEV